MWFLSRSFGMAWLISLICFLKKFWRMEFLLSQKVTLICLCFQRNYDNKVPSCTTVKHHHIQKSLKKKTYHEKFKGRFKKIFNSIMSFECKYKTRNYQFSSAKLEEKQTIYFLSHGHKSQQLSFCWPKS